MSTEIQNIFLVFYSQFFTVACYLFISTYTVQRTAHILSNINSLTQHSYQKRDDLKKQKMTEMGNTLIAIPCWWDGTELRYM